MTIKKLHVITPIVLLLVMGVGMLFLLGLRVPGIPALYLPSVLVSVWVYYDSRTFNLRYSREWERTDLISPFWLGVTALIFAPLGLPLYTYELYALNNTLKQMKNSQV